MAEKVDEDSKVIQAFRIFQNELDNKHDKHERIVKLSRDITIESKRVIFLLQRLSGNFLKKRDSNVEETEHSSNNEDQRQQPPESVPTVPPPPQPPPTSTRHPTASDKDLVFYGNVSLDYPSIPKVVRIFTSSTFTDTKMERNILMEKSYPKLKTFCQERGYEFEVVDMRWGVRDEATDDHMGTNLCLRELEKCQKISTGPNFVSLLSHKYGYRSLPREVDATEFEQIADAVKRKEDKDLLFKWFQRDDNSVPPVYVLASVSKNIPDFLSKDREIKMAAKKLWWDESERMQATLATVAEDIFGRQAARKYLISVTEKEVEKGVLETKNTKDTCLWIKRNITDIDAQPPCTQLNRYKECLGEEEKWRESQKFLAELRDKKMMEAIPDDKILSYDVKWTDKGIDIDNKSHRSYLDKMSGDFERLMMEMINKAVLEREVSCRNDSLFEECVQHTLFCQEKYKKFVGRKETLNKIKDYVLDMSTSPLVVYGTSGSGKTSLMAMVAKQAWGWLNGNCVIVLRFIGTTSDSSNMTDFLTSIVQQMQVLCGIDAPITKDLKWLSEYLLECMTLVAEKQKLLLIIDSLDQFDSTYDISLLKWLPAELPSNVKIIVSTLEEERLGCFKYLQAVLKTKDNFIVVPELSSDDVTLILSQWFLTAQRTVTPAQRELILEAFEKCAIPLFLKLCFDEACRWSSFTSPNETVLQTTVREIISALFSRIEVLHGEVFVSRALGYLTISKSGLSTSELEDILSCDDDVLNDVYMYWTPPSRRLPPLLLVRLKTDIEQYLVDRGSDGVRVFYWYHRQFIEAAHSRYCTDREELLHTGIAEFFSGVWSNGIKKPFLDKNRVTQTADRLVSSQPIKFGNTYNRRKLNNLPYHRILAKTNLGMLKEECLCNFNFLLAKLISSGVRHLIEDFILAKRTLATSGKNDKSLELLEGALQLSQQALIYDPNQLAPQLLNRLALQSSLEDFLQQCKNCNMPYLYPDANILTSPGGQLVELLAGHKAPVGYLNISADGLIAVTSSEDETVKLWNLDKGQVIKTIEFKDKSPKQVTFACQDFKVLIQLKNEILAIEHPVWQSCYRISSDMVDPMFCVAGRNKSILAVFHGDSCVLYNANNGKIMDTVKHNEYVLFDVKYGNGLMCGSKSYIAVTNSLQDSITVLDLNSKIFGQLRKAMKKDKDGMYQSIGGILITKDEKQIICSNYMDNDLHIFDIKTLALTQICKGQEKDFCTDFQLTLDGKYLYCPSEKHVVVWNLETFKRTTILDHHQNVKCVRTTDLKTVYTISDDNAVRMWDLTKPTSELCSFISLGHKILTLETLSNCRYVLCHTELAAGNLKENKKPVRCFQLYDIVTKEILRQAVFEGNSPSSHHLVDDNTIAVVSKGTRKLKLIDIDTMTVKMVFGGRMNRWKDDFVVLYNGSGIAVPTRGRMNVKIYETNQSKTKVILKGGQIERIDGLQANQQSTILLVHTEGEGPLLIFNLQTTECIRKLYKHDFNVSQFQYNHCISTSGNQVGILATKEVPIPSSCLSDSDSESEVEESVICVWDLETDHSAGILLDETHMTKYHISPSRPDISVSVCDFVNLDDSYILTSHDDFIVRVWETKTGKLLKRLVGHTTGVKLYAIDKSPYFLTYGSWEEENALRLWDRKTLTCIASLKLDKPIDNITWCKDGKSFISTNENSQIIHWNMHHTRWSSDLKSYPVLFQNQVSEVTIALESDEDMVDDKEEFDTDDSEPEPDVDEDEDEEYDEKICGSENDIESDDGFEYSKDIDVK